MKSATVRYTASLSAAFVDELREMAKKKKIPSINHAINKAVEEYLKSQKASQYEALMRKAGSDEAFLSRTLSCSEDFTIVDSEVPGTW